MLHLKSAPFATPLSSTAKRVASYFNLLFTRLPPPLQTPYNCIKGALRQHPMSPWLEFP